MVHETMPFINRDYLGGMKAEQVRQCSAMNDYLDT
jgi:hypothetical protein